MFLAALFTIGKTWKQPKCPSKDEWIKMWYMYTMKYYSAFDKLLGKGNMQLENKKRQFIPSLLWGSQLTIH